MIGLEGDECLVGMGATVLDGAVVVPEADAIVNPNQPGCTFESKSLAGVGVMFYVLLVLRAELRQLWLNTSLNREQMLSNLQAWCLRAEDSGILALQDFSRKLRAAKA